MYLLCFCTGVYHAWRLERSEVALATVLPLAARPQRKGTGNAEIQVYKNLASHVYKTSYLSRVLTMFLRSLCRVLESMGPTNTRVYRVAVYFKGKRLAEAEGPMLVVILKSLNLNI